MHEERTEPASDIIPRPAESQPISENEPSAQQPENLAPAGPKFCGQCGAPWTGGKDRCEACGRILPVDSSHAAALMHLTIPDRATPTEHRRACEQEFVGNRLALSAALKLYFSQLAVCIVLLAARLANPNLTLGWQFAAEIALAVVTVWWAVARRTDVVPQCRAMVGPQWYLIAIGSAVGTYLMASLVVHTLTQLTGMPEAFYCDQFKNEGYGFGWMVLSICIMPAVFEEIAFRGVILEAMRGFLTCGEAVLVSALLFAILHLSVPSIPHLCVMGIILAQLRLASGSLIPGIVMHFTHNLLVVLSELNENGILPW